MRTGIVSLILAMLLPVCAAAEKQKLHPPEKSITFPHGQNGPVNLSETHILLSNSWSRGNGLLLFEISDNGQISYAGGLPSLGYAMSTVFYRDTLYMTTTFSLIVADVPTEHGKPLTLARNIMIGFPDSNAKHVKRGNGNSDKLFLACADGLRVFDITIAREPVLCAFHPEIKNVQGIGTAEGVFFYVVSDRSDEINVCSISEEGKLTFKKAIKVDGPVSLLAGSGDKLIYSDTKTKKLHLKTFDKDLNFTDRWTLDLIPESILVKDHVTAIVTGGSPKKLMIMKDEDLIKGFHDSSVRSLTIPDDISISLYKTDFNSKYIAFLDSKTGSMSLADITGDTVKRLSSIPVIFSEGNLLVTDKMVYSLSPAFGEALLYGFDYHKPNPGMNFDVAYTMPRQPDAFDYYIVVPATAMKELSDRYIVANGYLLDVSDPKAPKEVKDLKVSASHICYDKDRKLLYLAAKKRLVIEDVSSLPETVRLGEYAPSEKDTAIVDVEVKGDYAYILNKYNMIEVLDVSDPKNPVKIAEYKLPFETFDFEIYGNRLYIPAGKWGTSGSPLLILDVSDPKKPIEAKIIPNFMETYAAAVYLHDGKFYVSDNGKIREFDLSDPLSPKFLHAYEVDGESPHYAFFTVRDGKIYAKKYSGIDIWNIIGNTTQE